MKLRPLALRLSIAGKRTVAGCNKHCREAEARDSFRAVIRARRRKEAKMPLVILWIGIPILLFGGGYYIIHAMH